MFDQRFDTFKCLLISAFDFDPAVAGNQGDAECIFNSFQVSWQIPGKCGIDFLSAVPFNVPGCGSRMGKGILVVFVGIHVLILQRAP